MAEQREIWVFGYGSLMWNPGFAYVEAVHARAAGYRRGFFILSTHYRGSETRPGLVLGLDRGGMCEGLAFRVAAEQAADVISYLRAREQINGVYREAWLEVSLLGEAPREVQALAFLVERAHPSHAGALTLAQQARLIRGARGRAGTNVDYLNNTLAHLAELGIRERSLERLSVLVGALFRRQHGPQRSAARVLTRVGGGWRVPGRRLRVCDRQRFAHRARMT